MAFRGNHIATNFKKELLDSYFTGGSFKIALYDNNASFNANTESYTATNEVSGTGYTAGGKALTVNGPSTGNGRAWIDFDDVSWTGATFTARGALIYNTATNDVIAVLDFGSDRSVTSGTFTVKMPSADSLNAIVLIK